MQSELSFLSSLTPSVQTLLQGVHALDKAITDRMNLVATTPQDESQPVPQTAQPNESRVAPIVVNSPVTVTTSALPPTPQNRFAQLPFSAILSDDFLNSCLWIEDTIGLSAHDLICCMGFETGRIFSPSVKNPGSSAIGLIQFMAATAKRLGTSTEALSAMDQVHQLNYVFKYFQDFRHRGYDLSKWNLGDTYMAILYPPGIGKSDDTPIFVEGKGANYAANRGLDADKNGFVTRGECLLKIREVEIDGMKHRRGGE